MHPENLENRSVREANQDGWNLINIGCKKDAAVDTEVSLTSTNI